MASEVANISHTLAIGMQDTLTDVRLHQPYPAKTGSIIIIIIIIIIIMHG
jgi:uncharacterized protein YhhL (DUF1145 family)